MARQLTQYGIFVASPEGLQEERGVLRNRVDLYNRVHGEPNLVLFKPVEWKDTLPGAGRPQELINRDLQECDYAIFMFRDRWGSASGSEGLVGTEEEWLIANQQYEKKVLRNLCLFFKEVSDDRLKDPGEQLRRVLEFRARIRDEKKHLWRDYEHISDFLLVVDELLAFWGRSLGRRPMLTLAMPVDYNRYPASSLPSSRFETTFEEVKRLLNRDGDQFSPTIALYLVEKASELDINDLQRANVENARIISYVHLDDLPAAIRTCDSVLAAFGYPKEQPALRERVANAMIVKGLALGRLGRSDEAVGTFNQVLDALSGTQPVNLQFQIGSALVNKGTVLSAVGDITGALLAYGEVLNRFGASQELQLAEPVAKAFVNKAILLKGEEALKLYDQVIFRFGTSTEYGLQEPVAKALVNKALKLPDDDAFQLYAQVFDRFAASKSPDLDEPVARAFLNGSQICFRRKVYACSLTYIERALDRVRRASNLDKLHADILLSKGLTLSAFNRNEEAVSAYDELYALFSNDPAETVFELVAKALVNKAVALSELGIDSLVIYDHVIALVSARLGPTLIEPYARALLNKSIELQGRGRHVEAIAAFDDTILRLGSSESPLAHEAVGEGMLGRATILAQIGRTKEAIDECDRILDFCSARTGEWINAVMSKALFCKINAAVLLHLDEEVVGASDRLIEDFGNKLLPDATEFVWKTRFFRATSLRMLDRHREALQALEEALKGGEDASAENWKKYIANALVERGTLLFMFHETSAALDSFDLVLSRYEKETASATVGVIARAMFGRALALSSLNRREELGSTLMQMKERFEQSPDPEVIKMMILARKTFDD